MVRAGAPLSALDGVLVGVKDEIDCLPYPTTGGTRWLGAARRCEADAACVAQLRACGAVLAGKANMHELGAGTSGINPHHGYALCCCSGSRAFFFLSLSLFCAVPETLRDAAPSVVRVQCAGRRGTRTTPARSPGAPPAAPPPSSAPASAPSRSASTEAVRARADLLWPLLQQTN
jgi:hypothetical protein